MEDPKQWEPRHLAEIKIPSLNSAYDKPADLVTSSDSALTHVPPPFRASSSCSVIGDPVAALLS